jgi:hypothetical protein
VVGGVEPDVGGGYYGAVSVDLRHLQGVLDVDRAGAVAGPGAGDLRQPPRPGAREGRRSRSGMRSSSRREGRVRSGRDHEPAGLAAACRSREPPPSRRPTMSGVLPVTSGVPGSRAVPVKVFRSELNPVDLLRRRPTCTQRRSRSWTAGGAGRVTGAG